MLKLTKAAMLKETKKIARENGLIFKKQNSYINDQPAYVLTDRKTGEILARHLTISGGYNDAIGGRFAYMSPQLDPVDPGDF